MSKKLLKIQKEAEQQPTSITIREYNLDPNLPDPALCVCGGGKKFGHLNQSNGFCCPHFGNTCGHCN